MGNTTETVLSKRKKKKKERKELVFTVSAKLGSKQAAFPVMVFYKLRPFMVKQKKLQMVSPPGCRLPAVLIKPGVNEQLILMLIIK